MKKLIALLAVACVGFVSCSNDDAALDLNNPNDLKKKFDFSEVDTDNLQGIHIENGFDFPDVTVISGVLNDCLWFGLFDTQSGNLKYQYTDVDHPASYFAYGEEYKYGIGSICEIYLENNQVVFLIRYSHPQYNIYWWDLIVADGAKQYRYIIDKESSCYSASIMKWMNNSIYITVGVRYYSWNGIREDEGAKGIIYDVENNIILSQTIGLSGTIEDNDYFDYNLIISPTNVLHFWKLYFSNIALMIQEYQCTYDTISSTQKAVKIYNYIQTDPSQAPRYSFEYKTRTEDHISAIVTQTEYDGTVTTKTVDIRVENDELIVDIQE